MANLWDPVICDTLVIGATIRRKVGTGEHPPVLPLAIVGKSRIPDMLYYRVGEAQVGHHQISGPRLWIFRWRPGIGQERMKYYFPSNPQTPKQMNWRFVFAEAIAAWKALSEEDKAKWNKKGTRQGTKGTYLFRSHFLKWRKNEGGAWKVGTTRVGGLDYVT